MTQIEFEEYLDTAVGHLADEISKARDLPKEDGMKAALTSFKSLFPENQVLSTDQYVYHLVADGEKVGIIHFGIKRDKKMPYVYLWDIAVDSKHRGKGFGQKAMETLDTHVKQLGIKSIRLNVFGHNTTAVKLYEKIGYRPESMALVKHL